jgi:hypothetical protein
MISSKETPGELHDRVAVRYGHFERGIVPGREEDKPCA